MAKNQTPFSIAAPGFYGLNLSDAPVDLSSNFALEANNCVIDKSGRIAARKGWVKANTTNADLGTNSITCIGELVQNDGTATTLVTGGGFLFKLSGGALVKLTYGGGGSTPTINANNWKFCQLNGVAMFWQRGYDPLIYDPVVSTTTFRRLNEKAGTAGTVYQCNEAISAYGRVWAADTSTDKNTVVFSDLLSSHVWSGGTSGSLNLIGVWPSGGDEIVALAAHNNFLYVFGKWQTLVYSGAGTPSTMALSDAIVGVGCIARDSVQNVGDDILFLSDSGVTSLKRVIQEKSAPIRRVSKNIHDDLKLALAGETLANVKSGYSATENIYLLALPGSTQTYCFDTRAELQDGSARTTVWPGTPSTAFYETNSRVFYLGKQGYVGTYSGYLDDVSAYRLTYFTTWIDFGNPIQKSILKKIKLLAIGGSGQDVVFKWAYDFNRTYFSESSQIPAVSTLAEYGIAEYGIAEYSANLSITTLSANGSSSGQVLQFGFEAQISGSSLSIQKVDLLTKDGRI